MRILHVSDVFSPQVGGIEVFVDGLARHQAASGHQVSVLTATRVDKPDRMDVYDIQRTKRLGLPGRWDPKQYDVVHVHLSVLSPLATLAARAATRAGVPTVLSVHSMWTGRRSVVRAVGGAAGWQHSQAVWAAVSEAAGLEVRRVLPRAMVCVVPNAVDVAWWAAVERIPHDEVTLLSVMRLAGRKRPLQLVDMLHEVRRQTLGVPLRAVIIGEGPLQAKVERRVRRLGMADWVTLAGNRTPIEIREWNRTADVYVAPATRESFGIAALESRAAGLPVVAMSSGGVREFIGHGHDGLLCADDDEMTAALTRLVIDSALRAEMTRHNLATPPCADWSHAVQNFDAVYDLAAQRVGYKLNSQARLDVEIEVEVVDRAS